MKFNGTKSIPSLIGLLVIIGLLTLLASCGHPEKTGYQEPMPCSKGVTSAIKKDFISKFDSETICSKVRCYKEIVFLEEANKEMITTYGNYNNGHCEATFVINQRFVELD